MIKNRQRHGRIDEKMEKFVQRNIIYERLKQEF